MKVIMGESYKNGKSESIEAEVTINEDSITIVGAKPFGGANPTFRQVKKVKQNAFPIIRRNTLEECVDHFRKAIFMMGSMDFIYTLDKDGCAIYGNNDERK